MYRMRILLCVAMLAAGFTQDASADQRFALIITNQDYSAEIGALSKSHADGEIVGDALRRIGFNVRLVRDSNKADMLGAVSEYADQLQKAGSDGVGFFYYSGHGAATEKFGDNYLIPVGAQIGSQIQLAASGLKLGDVIDILSQTNAQANFIVIDACRNVAFSQFRGRGGLKPEVERQQMLIEFSTGPGSVAVDDNIFSKALAEEMLQPGREALQVFRAVRLKVLDATENRQFPWTREGLVRDFWFAGPPQQDASAGLLHSARMVAEWESIKESGDTSLLEKFETRYPGELLGAEAKRRRLALVLQRRRNRHPSKKRRLQSGMSPAPIQARTEKCLRSTAAPIRLRMCLPRWNAARPRLATSSKSR